MNIRLGEKIRSLRKSRNISQEVLANYLGISFQAVSKWEKGETLPDVTLIPAIACFFEVSTDELFDFNRLETEQKVQQACWDIADWRNDRPEEAEKAYRDLLKQYPGSEIILANLLYVLQNLHKNEELIDLCKTFIATTKDDGMRYDAARIMAETYKEMDEYALCREAIDLIPEFFFTHREEKAMLLEGEDMFRPAWQEKDESMDRWAWMCLRLSDYYAENGEADKAKFQLNLAKNVITLLKEDQIPPFWKKNYYLAEGQEMLARIESRLLALETGASSGPAAVYTRFNG